MKKWATLGIAGSVAFGVLAAAPAHAEGGADIAVTSAKTGGVTGVFGNGAGTIANQGTVVIPAGTTFLIDVDDMPGLPDEVHVNSVNFAESGFASATPITATTQKWRVTTQKALAVGEVQSFSYTVLHYAPWHRVEHKITLEQIPGLVDSSSTNNTASGLNL